MAGEKKPDSKKPEAKPVERDVFVEVVWFMLSILVLLYVLNGVFLALSRSRTLSSDGKSVTTSGLILSSARPLKDVSNPIGGRVITTRKTDVYNSPAGAKIGEQKYGARGKILQGPVAVNGVKYWYVDFDSGVDGWVKEEDLAFLDKEPNIFQRMIIYFLSIAWYLKLLLILLSVFCIMAIIYLFRKINELNTEERKLLYPAVVSENTTLNPQWERILNHIESVNENDWRLAIIEADIILADLLERMHLPGESIGDKLKAVEESDFTTVENAWEAHKIRNRIAHDGDSFMLNQREAKRVIELYRTVFEEFQRI